MSDKPALTPRPTRQVELERFKTLLNTGDGEALMKELGDAWNPVEVFNPDPLQLARNAAQRDCYEYLRMLKNGDYISD